MKKLIIALSLVIGLAFSGSVATADVSTKAASNVVTTQQLESQYNCLSVQKHNWTEGTNLFKNRTVKSSVFVIPADGTVVVNKNVNKATAAAAGAYGDLRYVCTKIVPKAVVVNWS